MNIKIEFYDGPYWMEFQNIEYKKPVFHRRALELVFVMKGELIVDLEGEETVLYEGDIISVNAGLTHGLKGNKETYITSLYLNLDYYEKKYPYIHGLNFYCQYSEEDMEDSEMYHILRNYFIRLLTIEHFQIPKASVFCTEICDIVMEILINHIFDAQFIQNKVSMLKRIDKERLFSMTQYMAENFNQQGLSLSDIALHENLSATRLSHFWKSMTNISFMDTIGMYRYNEAKRLLMEGILSVSEITERCGYSDEKYLYKVFKQNLGMTPKEFRNQHKKMMETLDIYRPRNLTEIFSIISEYGEKYYRKIDDFSYLEDEPERMEEEQKINDVYSVISAVDMQKVKDRDKDSDSYFLHFGINSGLRYENDDFQINWEYLYAITMLTNNFFTSYSIIIDAGLMSAEKWSKYLKEIRSKIIAKNENGNYIHPRLLITYMTDDEYQEAVKLANMAEHADIPTLAHPILKI